MTSKTNEKSSIFSKYFSLITSALLILTGILYVIAACHLFFTGGDNPYTRERVGDYLIWLSVPSALTVLAVIAGAVIKDLGGGDKLSTSYQATSAAIERLEVKLKKLNARFNLEASPVSIKRRIAKQKRNRLIARIVALSATFIAVCASAVCLFNFDRFTVETLNADVVSAIAWVFLFVGIAFAAWCAYSIVDSKATAEEIFAIKDAVRENPQLMNKQSDEKKASAVDAETLKYLAEFTVILVAVIFITLGILNGGMEDVLSKGVKICTECIGLG